MLGKWDIVDSLVYFIKLKSIFEVLDADHSGGLSWGELRATIGQYDPKKAEKMMSLADTDGDGLMCAMRDALLC
eukprot:gene20142-38801_t